MSNVCRSELCDWNYRCCPCTAPPTHPIHASAIQEGQAPCVARSCASTPACEHCISRWVGAACCVLAWNPPATAGRAPVHLSDAGPGLQCQMPPGNPQQPRLHSMQWILPAASGAAHLAGDRRPAAAARAGESERVLRCMSRGVTVTDFQPIRPPSLRHFVRKDAAIPSCCRASARLYRPAV